ncbi:MAG: DUF4105 domain-containing protein, partial [Verrucomicrobia bacterium]|nr:DUF4105 domain-containing protein [Cytophagales bacterium]
MMNRKKIIASILSIFSICFSLAAQNLSENAQISLITIAPGDELYSGFGHSALHVYDPNTGMDKSYNYGTFDFRAKGFYVKFVRGQLDYMLSVGELGRELIYWGEAENRQVTQQILNLSAEQKNRLYQFLEKNALPENKFYRYDFFYDNCSTRIRDALQKTIGESLKFNPTTDKEKSFRDLTDEYLLPTKKWEDLGIDVALGLRTDKIATPYEYMFLPDY